MSVYVRIFRRTWLKRVANRAILWTGSGCSLTGSARRTSISQTMTGWHHQVIIGMICHPATKRNGTRRKTIPS